MVEIAVTNELVKELAKAARLILSDEETKKYTQQLSVILDAFRELDEVSTEGVEPSYHPINNQGQSKRRRASAVDVGPLGERQRQ